MKKVLLAAAALLASTVSLQAFAQAGEAYWGGSAGVWKNSVGNCWRTGYWTPANATPDCDPDLARKPPAPPPPVAPAPKPAAPVAKPAPKPAPTFTVTLTDTFASNSAVVSPAMRKSLDDLIARANKQFVEITGVHVDAHTDRLGSHQYNQKLSERRANAVAAYLVSRGVDKSKIETLGSGKINPVKSCPDQKDRKALNECLAPNRRVIVEMRGKPR